MVAHFYWLCVGRNFNFVSRLVAPTATTLKEFDLHGRKKTNLIANLLGAERNFTSAKTALVESINQSGGRSAAAGGRPVGRPVGRPRRARRLRGSSRSELSGRKEKREKRKKSKKMSSSRGPITVFVFIYIFSPATLNFSFPFAGTTTIEGKIFFCRPGRRRRRIPQVAASWQSPKVIARQSDLRRSSFMSDGDAK